MSLDVPQDSKIFQKILEEIDRFAPYKTPVLITGEEGMDKEPIARMIHLNSPRSEQNFVFVNCGTLDETLLDRDLFGYERGAFPNALTMHKGRLEFAHGGTIFLDEIDKLSKNLQFKILRVLKENKIERIGSYKPININIRFVAGANRDLMAEVKRGSFMIDLFYRLNVINLNIPSLRDNSYDIPSIINHFIKKYCALNDKSITSISKEAVDLLKKYKWPGNIFELESIIERAVVLCNKNIITKEDMKLEFLEFNSKINDPQKLINIDILDHLKLSLSEILEQIEELIIRRALEKTGHVQVRAAEMLGITKSLLQYKLKKYHLTT